MKDLSVNEMLSLQGGSSLCTALNYLATSPGYRDTLIQSQAAAWYAAYCH